MPSRRDAENERYLHELTATAIGAMAPQFPELSADAAKIHAVIDAEEAAFAVTLRTGTAIFDAAVGADGEAVVLKLTGDIPPGSQLGYGYGLNPYCNLVDGLDITDPVDGTFSANLNFDSISQMDLLLLAVDALQVVAVQLVAVAIDERADEPVAVEQVDALRRRVDVVDMPAVQTVGREELAGQDGRVADQQEVNRAARRVAEAIPTEKPHLRRTPLFWACGNTSP